MEPTVIDVFDSIRETAKSVLKELLLLTGLTFTAALAPIILVVLPLVSVILHPNEDFSWLAVFFVFTTPFAVALWMAFLCHWHGIRQWQRAGKLSTYHEDHGGLIATNLKSTGFLVLGFFGSWVCEMLFVLVCPYNSIEPWKWFLMFPFAAFAPVFWLLNKRGNKNKKESDFSIEFTPDQHVFSLAEMLDAEKTFGELFTAMKAEDLNLARSIVKQLEGTYYEVTQDRIASWKKHGSFVLDGLL